MGPTPARARRRADLTTLITLFVTGALLLAACTSDDDGDASMDAPTAFDSAGEAGEAPPDRDADGTDERAEAPERDGDGTTSAAPVLLTAADLGRSIIYTATLTVEVDDVSAASRQAQQAMAGLGGVLFGQETTTSPRPRTVLVFKVQPADFGEAMARLEGVGRVVAQDVSADDVTARVVDLRSRILTAEVSVERLRRLLDGATTVEAIAALEGQLLDRETNLEQLRGQLRTLEAQVALATITVTLTEEASDPSVGVAVTAYDGDDAGERCPGERRLEIDEGDSVVLCVAIENTGNVALAKIEVRDPGLDLRREDVTLIDFDADDRLAPGETVMAWAHFDAERRSTPRPSVTAVAVDDAGETIRTNISVSDEPLTLVVLPDDSLPGFGDSFASGWGAVQRVLGVVTMLLGVALPFAVLAAVPTGVWLWFRRREDEGTLDDEPTGAPSPA
jgi:hypothetical protein